MSDSGAREAFRVAGISRGKIDDAITAWRNGATYNAVHPLANTECAALWDDDYVKDLARVIMASLCGEDLPVKPLPWNSAGPVPDGYYRD